MKQNLAYDNFVKPLAQEELQFLHKKTSLIKDQNLSKLAQWSIETKAFHSLGAAIFSLPLDRGKAKDFIQGIVAFETIADFLDTVCDRGEITKEENYAALHNIIVKTVALENPDEYNIIPSSSEYFKVLINRSQNLISRLPSYPIVRPFLIKSAKTYSYMQTFTHLPKGVREEKCKKWFTEQKDEFEPDITWWEFTAAGGSTLTLFALLLAAYNPNLEKDQALLVYNTYYPWMNGINILMDSFIDQDDDNKNGDMNFMTYYKDENAVVDGLSKFIKTAWQKSNIFHWLKPVALSLLEENVATASIHPLQNRGTLEAFSSRLELADFHHFVIAEMVGLYANKAMQNYKLKNQAVKLLSCLKRLNSS